MPEQQFDDPIVVIGSGPCGAVAAHQLVERRAHVIMLDSGDAPARGTIVRAAGNTMLRTTDESLYLSNRLSRRSSDGAIWYSSLSHGGLSNYWTAAVPRFAPDDFDEGGRMDERFVWPVGYDELVPFYEAAERHLVVTDGDPITGLPPNVRHGHHRLPGDWRSVAEQANQHGHGLGAIPMAKGTAWMVARRPTEFHSFHCIVRPLLESPRFELRSGAHAANLIWSSAEGRVVAVEYVDRASGELRRLAAHGVVVAAGTVDSTMLLLRSTSADFPRGLGNTNDLLGRYLHDHPREWWPATLDRPMRALSHPMYLARRAHSASEPLYATSHTIGLARRSDRLRTYVMGSTRSIGVQVFGTMVPQADRGIELDPSGADDPIGQRPIITLEYTDRDVANLVAGRDRFRDAFTDAGLGVAVDGPFHGLTPGSSVHLAGTVRMHTNPDFGVLDAWNRVRDAPNVAVTDLSAFTTGPEKNPTLTAMALSIRAADRLASDLQ